jgi:hypothetical protein
MRRFDAIRSERVARPVQAPTAASPAPLPPAPGRTGKKAISAYFSREMSRALHQLALDQGTSLQALMGEAFDDLLRKYGKHPFGER